MKADVSAAKMTSNSARTMPVYITSEKDFLKFKKRVPLSNREQKSKLGDNVRNSLTTYGGYDNCLPMSRAGGLQEQLQTKKHHGTKEVCAREDRII